MSLTGPSPKSQKDDPPQVQEEKADPPTANKDSVPVLTIQSPLFKHQKQGLAENNPEAWRKIVEAQAEHEDFLDKLGMSEEKGMKAHYDEAVSGSLGLIKQSVMGNNASTTDVLTKSLLKPTPAIPWRRKDVSNPIQERKKVFDTFNKIVGSLPKTPPSRALLDLETPRPQTQTKKKPKKEVRKLKFSDIPAELRKPPGPAYPNATAKVDTGLGQNRKVPPQRYGQYGFSADNANASRAHLPLTIGPRLPDNFGQRQYEAFKANRALTIANVVARLHPDRPKSRNFRRRDRISVYDTPAPGTLGIYPNFDRPLSPRQSANRMNQHKAKPANPVQVLRAPNANIMPAASTSIHVNPMEPEKAFVNRPFSNAEVIVTGAARQVAKFRPPESNNTEGPRRRYRPSQLQPLHIPGPKYDNIYIGPYSGSESDRDSEDNMDRPVKSRKR